MIEPIREMTRGKIDQIMVSQKRSVAALNLLVWLTSEPLNLLE